MNVREEKDLLGNMNVPENALWGIHTARAIGNFDLGGNKTAPLLIKCMAMVKKACAQANSELGHIDDGKARAIISACDDVIGGGYPDQFPVDALQGGAGTSLNMNMNEVIANRGIELLGGKKGEYSLIDPLNDVNLHQSTNDVYPTSLRIACILGLRGLSTEISSLQGAFQEKEKEFTRVVKMGRTELQKAVPMTLGAEFSAFAEAVARDRWRTFKCEERLRMVNIGGTAIGTGLTAPREYIFLVIEKLRALTGLGISRAENTVDATANSDVFVEVSGMLKAAAQNMIKISNDLRLLHMLGDITLPAVQAGSSIMPGKINPVILESAIQAGIKVTANDIIVSECVSRGTLQINEFMPLLSMAILESIEILTRSQRMLASHIKGITAGTHGLDGLDDPVIITAFLPLTGYSNAMELLKEFKASGMGSIVSFLNNKLGEDVVKRILSPENLTALGYKKNG